MNIYEEITEKIIAQLGAGTPPWVRPWRDNGQTRPANALTNRTYKGINTLILLMEATQRGFDTNHWMTYRQAASVGGYVRRGARGVPVVFYQFNDVEQQTSDGESGRVKRPILRVFTVFNVAEIADLPDRFAPQPLQTTSWDPHVRAEHFIRSTGASVTHGGNRAYYSPGDDRIQLPSREAFLDGASYYATALHELVHWSGHSTRCARQFGRRFDGDSYAFEELVAELGAAFLSSHCQIDGQLQHANYIAAWLGIMRADKRAVFHAAAKAQQAADYLVRIAEPAALESLAA